MRRLLKFLLVLSLIFEVCAQVEAPASSMPFNAEVRHLLEVSCAQCHDGTTSRRDKGDFATVLDVPAMIKSDYFLVPGQPEQSEIYLLMTEEDPEYRMPPADSDAHQPTPAEIEMVRRWILDLDQANVDSEKSIHDASGADSTKVDTTKKAPPTPRVLFARMHPLVVHFPVAVVPMAAFIAIAGLLFGRYERWLPAIRWSLLVGAVVAPLAADTGWQLADVEGFREATVQWHRWLGVTGVAVTWICLLAVEIAERRTSLRPRMVATALLVIAAILIAIVGHTGGELVYGKGYPFQ